MRYLDLLTVALMAISTVLVAAADDEVMYFEPDTCADGKGYTACSKDAYARFTDCNLNFCDESNYSGSIVDCMDYICKCTLAEHLLTCAQTHCWNKVYSCEYQNLATDLHGTCLNMDSSEIPFWPAPEDAPGSCSCNVENIVENQNTALEAYNQCNEQYITPGTGDEFLVACACCMGSSALSGGYNICPNTEPSEVAFDEGNMGYETAIDEWHQCADYIEAHPCEDLGFPAPGPKGSKFYAPGTWPKNGTETLRNVAGDITSPVSGSVYTYTMNKIETIISVASVDAKPTGNSGNGKGSDKNGGGNGNSINDDSSSGGSSSGDGKSGDADTSDDKDDAAAIVVPKLVFVVVPALVAALLL